MCRTASNSRAIRPAIDFIAGVSKRAPRWMQRIGFEWLWRLVHEPQRLWKRYLVNDLAFIRIVLEEWLRLHGSKRGHRQANVGSSIEG
jgi:N-acetylglucosaminyldiphosphoundecaprenol N-acetyl-beta-D-mannosaminyltransferase